MIRPTLVVDASVAVKWLLPEDGHEKALRVQEQYQDEKVDLIAPYLVVPEVGNVLWKRVRRGDLSSSAAERCFEQFLHDLPVLVDTDPVNAAALGLALAHQRSVYDCLYLAWALEQRCDLLTADERFFNALHSVFRCIQLLADFEL